MEHQPNKRTFQSEPPNPSDNATKKQKIEKVCKNKHPVYRENNVEKSYAKEKKQTMEMRLEANRQRAKEIRKRKKLMIEDMQKQLVLLTMENDKLRTENQKQQQDLIVLRKTSQLLTSNNQAVSFGALVCLQYV